MSNKEIEAYLKTIEEGFIESERILLKEKAAKNEPVINCDENGNIVRIPAEDIIARHRQYQ